MFYVCLGALALLGFCALTPGESSAAQSEPNPVVELETSMGAITIELDPAKAPISVANFLKYVDEGFYDGLIFHRVIPGFMIQGGGMTEKMEEKIKGQHGQIKNEAGNGLSNKRGTIAMARTNQPDSATSQFFINLVDNSGGLDRNPSSAGYTVFGRVTSGMEVVDAIAQVQTGRRGPHGDVPVKPILIKSAKRKAKS